MHEDLAASGGLVRDQLLRRIAQRRTDGLPAVHAGGRHALHRLDGGHLVQTAALHEVVARRAVVACAIHGLHRQRCLEVVALGSILMAGVLL